MDIPSFFKDVHQPWNQKYPAAQKIFGNSPVSLSIRGTIHGGHKLLYARSTANTFGILENAPDLMKLFKDETAGNRVKPAVYTYIINDDTWRFSETGAVRLRDFCVDTGQRLLTPHALHRPFSWILHRNTLFTLTVLGRYDTVANSTGGRTFPEGGAGTTSP